MKRCPNPCLATFVLVACACNNDSPVGNDAAADVAAEPPPSLCDLASVASVDTALSISTGRYAPGVAVTAPGDVLLAGGYDFATGATATSEIVDGAGGATTALAKLKVARNFLAAAPLPGGSFLFAGGFDPSSGSVATVDVYSAGAFTSPTQMTTGREAHTATALPDGRVLVAGGLQAAGFTFHQTAELFDPNTVSFTKTAGTMTVARAYHVAAWIDSQSKVVLVAGANGPSSETATAELFDPSSNAFTALGTSLTHASKAPAASLLNDARLLVAGGANETDKTLSDAHVYDPTSSTLTPVASMNVRRMAFSLTKLADGRVLAVGGWSDTEVPSSSTATLEVYDPKANTWTLLPVKLAVPRHDHVAVLLPDCRVAVMAGQSVMPSVNPIAPRVVELVTVPTLR